MASHPIDFQLQANFYSTPELAAVFDEQRKMSRWLEVEAALARTQGELGIIPAETAREIAARAKLAHFDLAALKEEYQRSRNSLLPVVRALRRACGPIHGEYVHYGATTQDILDTAQILELRDTLQILFRDLRKLESLLLNLSERHRATPMIGRTHGQQALPITFGLKTAVWTSELRRHIERLKWIYPRVMVGQLGGAVGTMAALGPRAREVAKGTMALLDLGWAAPGWHTSRDNLAEVASLFAILAGTFEKIANEIFLLGKTETGELAESAPDGLMSSTMPHKKNPVFCQRIAVLARQIRPLSGSIVADMAHEHERDPRLLWAEWLAMPQLCIYTGTAAAYLLKIIPGLRVNEENMRRNLLSRQELIMSEWLLFRLAAAMGKMKAQEKLHQLLQQAETGAGTFRELLAEHEEIGPIMTEDDFNLLGHPERYVGQAVELVEETLAKVRKLRQTDPEVLA